MKFLTIFAALIAVACAGKTWSLQDLSQAIESPHTDPTLKTYLIEALDDVMDKLIAGNQVESVTVTIPASSGVSLTLSELSDILQNPYTDYALMPYYEDALNHIMAETISGNTQTSATVVVPAMDIYHFTLYELSNLLEDPTTNPALVPYLEHALDKIMVALYAGEKLESIVVAIPVVEAPAPVAPVVPVTPVPPVSAASPLVQIIINVKQQA